MSEPNVATNHRTFSDGDATQHGCVGVDCDIVLKYRVARKVDGASVGVVGKITSSECDTLINSDVITDDASFSDDDSGAMIDGEEFPDGSTRVYVDTGERMCHFRNHTGDYGDVELFESVRHAVVYHRRYDGVAEDYFCVVGDGGVIVGDGLDVAVQQSFNFGQLCEELQCQAVALELGLGLCAVVVESESVSNFGIKEVVKLGHIHTDIITANRLGGAWTVEEVGEYDIFYQLYNLPDRIDRGIVPVAFWLHPDFLHRSVRHILGDTHYCAIGEVNGLIMRSVHR